MEFAAFQYLKGLTKKVERDFSQGHALKKCMEKWEWF